MYSFHFAFSGHQPRPVSWLSRSLKCHKNSFLIIFRYIAVTHPITYPNLMTSKKAKLLISGAWILSFVICFPPLVGWNDKYEPLLDDTFDNATTTTTFSSISDHNNQTDPVQDDPDPAQEILDRCKPQCMLIQEPGYVIYSAVGSFFAPMLVMIFFNWKIYRYQFVTFE